MSSDSNNIDSARGLFDKHDPNLNQKLKDFEE
jgi:hypothetical protein